MAEVIDLEAHREVWMTTREVCRHCGKLQFGCVHVEADLDRLECVECHEMTSAVTHIDVGCDAEYIWRPRLQEVR